MIHCAGLIEFVFLMFSSKMQLYWYVKWTVREDIARHVSIYIWYVKHITSLCTKHNVHDKQVRSVKGRLGDCRPQCQVKRCGEVPNSPRPSLRSKGCDVKASSMNKWSLCDAARTAPSPLLVLPQIPLIQFLSQCIWNKHIGEDYNCSSGGVILSIFDFKFHLVIVIKH